MTPNCVKRCGLVVKEASMSQQAFKEHRLRVHATLCRKIPDMLRCSGNLVDLERFPRFGYGGLFELRFESEEALSASLTSPEGKTLLADLPDFTERIHPILADEHHQIWPRALPVSPFQASYCEPK